MYDWIEIDGIKSTAFEGLEIMSWTKHLFAKFRRESTDIPGSIAPIRSRYPSYNVPSIKIVMAIIANSEAALNTKWLEVKAWLAKGRRMSRSDMPDYYTLGEVTDATERESKIGDDGDQSWMLVDVVWEMAPGCYLRYLTNQTGWLPSLDVAIPQQLTADNATRQKSFTAAGQMDSVPYAGQYPARIYLRITGTWTTLIIGGAGGITVHQAVASQTTLYLDCSAQVIYIVDAGQQVNWSGVTSGDYPAPTSNFALQISGTGLNINVLMLVVEQT